MNFDNFTEDQKESFWIILMLLAMAAVIFSVAGLLFINYIIIISVVFFIFGLSLTALAVTGYYVAFVEKPRDDEKDKD